MSRQRQSHGMCLQCTKIMTLQLLAIVINMLDDIIIACVCVTAVALV